MHLKLSFKEVLLAPFRSLVIGRFILAGYLLAFFGSIIFISNSLETLITLALENTNFEDYPWIFYLPKLIWVCSVPFVIASVSVPVRVIWYVHSLPPKYLFRETFIALRKTSYAFCFSRREFFIVIAPFIAVALLVFFQDKIALDSYGAWAIFVLFLGTSLSLIYGLIRVFISISVSILADMDIRATLALGRNLVWARFGMIVKLIGLTIIWFYAIYEACFFVSIPITLLQILCMASIWYFLSAFFVIALEATEEEFQQMGKSLRNVE